MIIVITRLEDVQPFLNSSSLAVDLTRIQKSELLLITEYFGLECRAQGRKEVLLAAILSHLKLDEEGDSSASVSMAELETFISGEEETCKGKVVDSKSDIERLKLELELEKLKAEKMDNVTKSKPARVNLTK